MDYKQRERTRVINYLKNLPPKDFEFLVTRLRLDVVLCEDWLPDVKPSATPVFKKKLLKKKKLKIFFDRRK